MGKDEAREIFYGMTMAEWKANYHTNASSDQQKAFENSFKENVTDQR